MSTFSGKQFKGAMRQRREGKRAAAIARDIVSAHSKDGRKKRARLSSEEQA